MAKDPGRLDVRPNPFVCWAGIFCSKSAYHVYCRESPLKFRLRSMERLRAPLVEAQ